MTAKLNKIKYVCPLCKNDLIETKKSFLCKDCDKLWPIEYSIPKFAESELQYSVFSSDITDKVTELAERTTWQNAVDTYAATIGAYTYSYINDESRADFHVLLPLGQEATVLDIGSGWGNIAISLSSWCKHIYCGDVSMTNLRLLRSRMRDRDLHNVSIFQYEPNSFLRLPFPDASVDIVLLNGVLEWMGAAEINVSPARIQLEALKEIRRVLKPEGVIYIGIENRYSESTLRGQRIHGELPFVGLLPRIISNIITKIVMGQGHRTYIYTMAGYRKLLSRAGYKKIDFYIPYPSYHYPNYMIPLEPSWVKRFWVEQLSVSRSKKYQLFKSLGFSRLPFHWLAYSFGIRCVK